MRDFLKVASELVNRDPGLAACRPAIEKELLHIEILGAMNDAGVLRRLTFKGGTCLRLCHGGVRLSEDLDFSGGPSLDDAILHGIERLLVDRMARSYGLEVTVKPPRRDPEGRTRNVRRWAARVITRPASGAGGRVGVQRIKIDIDGRDHDSGDIEILPMRNRHALLQEDFTPFPIRAASLADIGSDKMIAFPMSVLTRDNPRHRDIWDIEWIAGRTGDPAALAERASRKAVALGIAEQYADALAATARKGRDIIESAGFRDTLQRFIPRPLAARSIDDAWHRRQLAETVESLCAATLGALSNL